MTPPGFSKAEGKCETVTAEKKKVSCKPKPYSIRFCWSYVILELDSQTPWSVKSSGL